MKTTALLACGVISLFAGCACEKTQFAGHDFKPNPANLEKVLAETAPKMNSRIHNNAVIRAVVGQAEVSGDGGATWKEAAVGQRLGANSVVRTSKLTKVDLFLGENGPVLRLLDDTRLQVVRLDIENTGAEKVIDTELLLDSGKILGSVKKMAAESRYVVRTKTTLVFIRGTEFSVSAGNKVMVNYGMASILRGGKTFEVRDGEQFIPGVGVRPMNAKENSSEFGGTSPAK